MPHTRFPILKSCALCGSTAPLQSSHLLPDFLFRRIREPHGHFYAASQPKRPVQRGAVAKLLCLKCEQLISRWESKFKQALLPGGKLTKLPVRYGPWLQLFAISVSWRALAFLKHATPNPYVNLSPAAEALLSMLPEEAHAAADEALCRWAAALLAEKAPTSQSDQQLLFLNGQNFPDERAEVVGFTVCSNTDCDAVFAQLGPVCVLGMIRDRAPRSWKGTRIQSLGGIYPVASQTIPQGFRDWLAKYFESIHAVEP